MTPPGRRPSAAMPKPQTWAYACTPCETLTGKKTWIGFDSEAERDAALDRHYYEQHAPDVVLENRQVRWIGCDELECVCGPWGPPRGHRRYRPPPPKAPRVERWGDD